MIVEHMTDLIGNTPILKIPEHVHGLENVTLYAKLEMLNPFGSVKDRIAWALLKDRLNELKDEQKTVLENSSGNTAKALQAIASSYGIPFKLMTSLAKVKEPLDILRVMGAEVEELSQASTDCFDPNDPNDPQYQIERFVKNSNGKAYFTSQFTNMANVDVHRETTGPEILADVPDVNVFVGGLGTTGSSRGIVEALKKSRPSLKCLGVCASEYDYIPGIRSAEQMWEVGLFERDIYDDIIDMHASDAVAAMIELNRGCALLCGPSAGAQYAAIKGHFSRNIPDRPISVVFLACDRMEWYLSYIRKYAPQVFEDNSVTRATDYANYYPFDIKANQIEVPVEHLTTWISESDPLIIDTRNTTSFRISHIDGAMNIPEKEFEGLLEKTQPFSPNKPVLLICAVGKKTFKSAAYLSQKGIRAYTLRGGHVAWQNYQKNFKFKQAA